MKNILYKIYILILFLLIFISQTFSQRSAFVGIYSGWGKTHYNMREYSSESYMPLGIRGGFGYHFLQLGPDIQTNIKSAIFNFSDSAGNKLYSEKIHDDYLGAMLRLHGGDDPHDYAIIFRIGAGVYYSKKYITYTSYYQTLHPEKTDETFNFKNSIGWNGAVGVSVPLFHSCLHFTIEGQFNYNPRIYNNKTNYHTTWDIQAGLVYYFFGRYELMP